MNRVNDVNLNEASSDRADAEKEQIVLRELDRAIASGRAKPGVFERLNAKKR